MACPPTGGLVFFLDTAMPKPSTKSDKYTGEQIVVLEGLEPVRKRPAMYIGTTSLAGVHHCLNEIIDNSIDEALAGFAKNVWVIVYLYSFFRISMIPST